MNSVQLPSHIGIILDGNRRFAVRRGEESAKGHEYGSKVLHETLNYLYDKGIKQVTLYVFSTENFNRAQKEKNLIMKLFNREFDKWFSKNETDKKKIRVNFIGNLKLFSEELQNKCRNIMDRTKDNRFFTINLAFGYGGREEIIHATKEISKDVLAGKLKTDEINEEIFNRYLYLDCEPDLIIRTGGRTRTSNFLPWQSAYSEWFFEDIMWPEMRSNDFDRIFCEFSERKRTFGK